MVREIRGYPELERLHSTTGAWDLVLQLRCRSLSEFDLVLDRIRIRPGIRDTQTSLLFNSLTTPVAPTSCTKCQNSYSHRGTLRGR